MLSIKELLNLYHGKQTLMSRLRSILRHILTINFGSALKECFVGNRLNTLPIEQKNILLTQELEKIIITQKNNGNSTDNSEKCLNDIDKFLEEKLGEDFQLFCDIKDRLEFNETIEFSEFKSLAEEILQKYKSEGKEEERKRIIERARILESIACPLTKKYFLFRHLAKAIICQEDSSLFIHDSYQEEKNLCLTLSRELEGIKSSNIQNASEKFSAEKRCVDRLLRVSDKVNNYAGKIAAIYVSYIAIITCVRYAKDDQDSEWYQLIALPSTILAVLQIAISFPQIIWSDTKAKGIRNHILEEQNGISTDIGVDDVQFLDQNIPTFSNNALYKFACFFRWISNLLLQPIDLIQNNTKDKIFRWGPIRWLTPTGVIEEQGKVAHFVHCELRNFLYNYVMTTNHGGIKNEHVDRIFYLLYKETGKGERGKEHLKEVYKKLTRKEDVNFENIVSDKEKGQISKYQMWLKATYFVAVSSLIAEYVCFSCRNQDIDWYEDPAFYPATIIKFMRLGSLLVSKYCAHKITEYFTDNKLDNNIYFQDFFYNDTARMAAAVAPLIMFESTGDIRILSIATAIDVLTTTRSDTNSGKALSELNQISTEKLVAALHKENHNIRE